MAHDADGTANAAPLNDPKTAEGGARILPLNPVRSTRAAKRTEEPVDNVFVRDRSGLQRISRNSILTLKADGNYVELFTTSKRFVVRSSLRDVVQQLGEHRFPQVNRHTAVNLERLDRVDVDSVEVDGEAIMLSRSYRQGLLDRLRVLSGR